MLSFLLTLLLMPYSADAIGGRRGDGWSNPAAKQISRLDKLHMRREERSLRINRLLAQEVLRFQTLMPRIVSLPEDQAVALVQDSAAELKPLQEEWNALTHGLDVPYRTETDPDARRKRLFEIEKESLEIVELAILHAASVSLPNKHLGSVGTRIVMYGTFLVPLVALALGNEAHEIVKATIESGKQPALVLGPLAYSGTAWLLGQLIASALEDQPRQEALKRVLHAFEEETELLGINLEQLRAPIPKAMGILIKLQKLSKFREGSAVFNLFMPSRISLCEDYLKNSSLPKARIKAPEEDKKNLRVGSETEAKADLAERVEEEEASRESQPKVKSRGSE